MRKKVLQRIYGCFPFNLEGDCDVPPARDGILLSCIINFYGRIDLLQSVLWSLAAQDLPKTAFEVILVEDRGGTAEGKSVAQEFSRHLPVVYLPLDKNFGFLGYGRNFGLQCSRGGHILFLDDDTVLLQQDFLSTLLKEFRETGADAVVPAGQASYCLVKNRYRYHERHFPTGRCTAYTRSVLTRLHGFVSSIVGQEDVEFVIRYIASDNDFHLSDRLNYFHPPLVIHNYKKAIAVGASFAGLRSRYSLPVWVLLLLNGCRYLPLWLVPVSMKWRMQARFSLGFLLGIYHAYRGKRVSYSDQPA